MLLEFRSSLSHQAGTETTTSAVSGVPRNRLESSKRVLRVVMSLRTEHLYQFGQFTLDVDQRVLSRQGKPLPLTPKVLETLLILVQNSGRILEKDELMRRLWPDTFVEEANLAFNIQRLRKSLCDDARNPLYIETVPRRGYRFIAQVEEVLNDVALPVSLLREAGREAEASGRDGEPSAPVAAGINGTAGDR